MAHRSPIFKYGSKATSKLNASELATQTLKAALVKHPIEKDTISTLYLGHARQANNGPNPARQVAYNNDLDIPAITVNQACASGLESIISGMKDIECQRADNVISGGVECMSATPYYIPKLRFGNKLGHQKIIDGMYQDGFHCPMANLVMGKTVEQFIAQEQKISRHDQDAFAQNSQQKYQKALSNNYFIHEKLNIELRGTTYSEDEYPRANSTLEKLAKLTAVFDTEKGTLTAGNSSGMTDGAAFALLSSKKSPTSLCEIIDYNRHSLNPNHMGLGPIDSIKKLLHKNSLSIQDIDLFEINEAFAAQAIACQKSLEIPDEKLNIWGGAISIGHPIGATGTRILGTLAWQMKTLNKELGVVSLCVSGGQGVSLLLKLS